MNPAAASFWRSALARWAIPDELLARAAESPYAFDVALFSRFAAEAVGEDTPSQRLALGALPSGGSVLDVGCGAGAASLPLAPPAGHLVGVDEQADMLAAFAQRAAERGVGHTEIAGRWPDSAAAAPVADVVVCHHVLYNVQDIERFVLALDAHARGRVVVELTQEHPLTWLSPYWRALHNLERPAEPTADDALAVVRALGIRARIDRWSRPHRWDTDNQDAVAEFVRRKLCLPPDRADDVRAAVRAAPPTAARSMATLWW